MKIRRRASPLVVFSLVAAFAALLTLLLPGEKPAVPDINFSLLDGKTLTLAQLRGRPVLISFWATSCAPCVEELPDLIRLHRELNPRGFELIAVAMPYDPPLQVQNFIRQHNVPYYVALDVSGTILRSFAETNFVPTAYLLNEQGEIVSKYVGKLDIERVRKQVAPFLKTLPTETNPPTS